MEGCLGQWNKERMHLNHYHTMPHFYLLKIYSCGKHCEKRRNCKQFLLFSQYFLPYIVHRPVGEPKFAEIKDCYKRVRNSGAANILLGNLSPFTSDACGKNSYFGKKSCVGTGVRSQQTHRSMRHWPP